jgi:hypothetical protein
MIELNRDDKQYLAVENFEDYELTYCMAYEMAIRNDEVIKTIFSFYENYVNDDMYNCFVLSTDDFKKCYKDAQKLMDFHINPLQLHLDYHFFKPIEEHIKEIKDILFSPFTKSYEHSKIIPGRKIIEYKTSKYYISFVSHLISNDEKESMTIHHNDITPNYSRPLMPNFKDTKERRLILNLSLPTSELIDFVKKLKKDYDRDHSIVKNLHELLTQKESESIGLPNIQKNYADLFFSYDCNKLGLNPSSIVTLINNYRLGKDNFKSIKKLTVENYISHGKKYIDEQYYKNLTS